MDFKAEIEKLLKKELGVKQELEVPPDSKMGDYAFPCFELAKTFKEKPHEIASRLSKKIKSKYLDRVETKGPYLNFFINKKLLAESLLKEIDDNYGRQKKKGKIVIDYSAPNIGKPMHIGHIRSTVIGDSLIKIYDFLGMKTVGINYLGDVGLHIGKVIVAYRLWVNKAALKKDPTKELLRIYVKFCDKENLEVKEGMDEDAGNNEWTLKAKEELRLIENGNKDSIKIWRELEKHSEKGFDKIYKALKIKFDDTKGQSNYSDAGKKIVMDALKKKKLQQEKDGAVFYEFDDEKRKYVLRSNKTASYVTQDLGAAVARFNKHKFTESIYITDFRQKLYFKQLFEILEGIGYGFSDKMTHVPFGTVKFGKEIIASRKGKLILLQDVIDKTIEKASKEVKKRKTKGDPAKIGIGALKYAILYVSPIKDVEFSWEKALSFEGNTGPYLQYTYARASSILAKKKPGKYKVTNLEEKEIELLKKMYEFPEIVEHAAREYNPALVATYAFELASKFNEFYHDCPVIGSETEQFRLNLVNSFRFVIKNSLGLLGIEVMKEM